MILTEYTVKKSIGKKLTIKTPSGGYDSDEASAEVTMTVSKNDSSEIDTKEVNQQASKLALELLNDEGGGKNTEWLSGKAEPEQQKIE